MEEITESNVLFPSVAARSKQFLVRAVHDWFSGVLDRKPAMTLSSRSAFTADLLDRSGYPDRLTSLLRAADTGIESAEIVEETDAEFAERSTRSGGAGRYSPQRRKDVFFKHRGENGTSVLGLPDQSLGTRALYEIGLPVFISLDLGSPLIVDGVGEACRRARELTADDEDVLANPSASVWRPAESLRGGSETS
ncbi:hypothetical protein ACLQ2R_09930 [Streptosporangium sp. DT93]